MADMYSFLTDNGYGGGRSMRNDELNEEDVWAVNVKERREKSPVMRKSKDPSSVTTLRRLPTASRMIPRANKPSSVHEPKVQQQSAPVNIPDWSKIYKKNSKKGTHISWANDDNVDDDCDTYGDVNVYDDINDGNGDDEEDEDWVPPHEWIAKKLARSQISSFSVCEGVGRTLKGRDLSKVRNAVLTRTGFLE